MISNELLQEYMSKCTNNDEKQFIQNAIDSGKCKFDYDYEIMPRQLAILAPVPEFKSIKDTYYGLYMLFMDGQIGVWLADDIHGIAATMPAGSYRFDEPIDSIISKSKQNLNVCDGCKSQVGLARLFIKDGAKFCGSCMEKSKR